MIEAVKDWYLCYRNDSTIDCIGPFMGVLNADSNLEEYMLDPVLISACKFIPTGMTSSYLKKRYNDMFSIKSINIVSNKTDF